MAPRLPQPDLTKLNEAQKDQLIVVGTSKSSPRDGMMLVS